MRPLPPKYALRFLRWFCRPDYIEEIEGDLVEIFEKHNVESPRRARRKFAWSVLRHFRPEFIKPIRIFNFNFLNMYRNYLTVSWRNLHKQRMYSAIKIGGFALGIAACFLISLFVRNELSYDKHVENHDQIFRVVGVFNDNGNIIREVWFPAPVAAAIRQEYPEAELVGRYNAGELFGAGHALVRRSDELENKYEEGVTFFDQSLLEILKIPMVFGSRAHALKEPNSIVITRGVCERYFGKEDPTGKLLIVNNDSNNPFVVGGVIDDFPATSHLKFDFLMTMSGREFWPNEQNDWGSSNYPTYVRVREGTDPVQLADKMTKGIVEKYYLPSILASGQMTEKAAREMLSKGHLELQPLSNIYLESDVRDGLSHGDMRFIWLFVTVAVFILIIAGINFINLSTARSANRAKEVGVRKVVGSHRGSLISQFLTESLLFSAMAFVFGILLAQLLLPYFNSLSGKNLDFPWSEWWLFPSLMIGTMLVGVMAGLYPAFYLSSFRPVQVLKGNLSRGSKGSGLRSSLVVFQFTTSIILIVSTFVIYRQMEFILNKELGFDKEHVLLIQGANALGEQVATFKEELLKTQQVQNVSVSDYLPIRQTKRNGNTLWREGRTKEDKGLIGQIWQVDADYIPTLGMKIIEGRNFDRDAKSDSEGVIVNQTLAKKLGLQNPVGERITNGSPIWNIIGVVEDFHFESLKSNIEPLVLQLGNSPGIVSVKVSGDDLQSSIAAVNGVWKKILPHQPLRYTFLDERYARMYDDLSRTAKIFTSFALFAIVVACLGLFALSAYMVEQSSKEISIRLILGASVNSVFRLLTASFVKLVIIAFIIATPIAWYAMSRWLEDYTYRTDVGWELFGIAGVIAVMIALFTVGYQSLRAALTNPVKNLRSE